MKLHARAGYSNSGKVKRDIEEAAKEVTKYIVDLTNGMWVTPKDARPDSQGNPTAKTKGWRIRDSIEAFVGETMLAKISTGAITFFNDSAKKLMELTTGALRFYDGTDETNPVAEFGATARVGAQATGKYNTLTDANGIHLRQNTTVLSEFTDVAARLGMNSDSASVSLVNDRMSISTETWTDPNPDEGTYQVKFRLGKFELKETTDSSIDTRMQFHAQSKRSSTGAYLKLDGDDRINLSVGDATYDSNSARLDMSKSEVRIYCGGTIKLDGETHIKDAYSNTSSAAANVIVGATGRLARKTSSSKRYKHNIEDISERDISPENLYRVKVRQFEYNDDYLDMSDHRYGKKIPGFIVEELEEVYPIAVDYNDDELPEDWNVLYLVPAMLKLIQNQHKEIERLKEVCKCS